MEDKKNKALTDFIDDDNEDATQIKDKIIKTDNTIIERIDKIIIAENGKQLLREQY